MRLLVVTVDNGRHRMECRCCPYALPIVDTIYSRRDFERVEKEDVFGGPGAWENAQKMRTACRRDECDGQEAAFYQLQIRSADEPMTTFFRVCAPSKNRGETCELIVSGSV